MHNRPALLFSRAVLVLSLAAIPALAQQTALATQQNSTDGQRTQVSLWQDRYRVRPGDEAQIEFALSPEFNQTVSVQPDGYISLRALGTIVAQGLTVDELQQGIARAYASILHDPIISVSVKDFEKPYFIATGQVGKPGKYDIRSDLTVSEGIAIAGGFTRSSKHSQVVLFRASNGGFTEARVINIKHMFKNRNLSEDVRLRPGDMIFVPQNRISRIERYLPTSSLGVFANPYTY